MCTEILLIYDVPTINGHKLLYSQYTKLYPVNHIFQPHPVIITEINKVMKGLVNND